MLYFRVFLWGFRVGKPEGGRGGVLLAKVASRSASGMSLNRPCDNSDLFVDVMRNLPNIIRTLNHHAANYIILHNEKST